MTQPQLDPLIGEATKRAAVAWIDAAGTETALWCLWSDDALLVVCGPGEQADPGFTDGGRCRVRMRGDHGGRIVGFTAAVQRIEPDAPLWEAVSAALAAKRLNSPAGDTVARWATDNGVWRLVPDPTPDQAGPGLPTESLAAAPRPTPAARPVRKPFRLHRVKKR
ncbi:hypothetical protein FB566_1642 [Stackebrandtia endophytica]|uniref:Uncharacterized protein n=1 Tax=Stackebrandtia endophytica TaxID=1496996 RepID=A0A543AU51_9ACTN|nr:hypothetical protein [Stackebrandtia endophytica]TQL76122.1 hypothetical protein FB566_1642 [Stackebrandtia endophytica]